MKNRALIVRTVLLDKIIAVLWRSVSYDLHKQFYNNQPQQFDFMNSILQGQIDEI